MYLVQYGWCMRTRAPSAPRPRQRNLPMKYDAPSCVYATQPAAATRVALRACRSPVPRAGPCTACGVAPDHARASCAMCGHGRFNNTWPQRAGSPSPPARSYYVLLRVNHVWVTGRVYHTKITHGPAPASPARASTRHLRWLLAVRPPPDPRRNCGSCCEG